MALSVYQVSEWLLAIFLSAIKLCARFALPLCTSISSADELVELSVKKTDGAYSLRVVSVLDAPVDYVVDP